MPTTANHRSHLFAALLATNLVAISAAHAYANDQLPQPTGLPPRVVDWQGQGATTILESALAPLSRSDLRILGAASCASAACHGGAQPAAAQASASRGAEYPLWMQNDPHARSWRSLCGEESVAMMRRLGIMRGDRIVDHTGFRKCLACHNPSHHEGAEADHQREGVGCAACHGPEELWGREHYRNPLVAMTGTEFGFVDNKDPLTRARVCASCHVGDHGRDMNHDMIAAGHPELRYEFATYHARLPKHWREENNCDLPEAQLWLVGQIASLDASLALLESRARSAPTTGSWPEFAEYDCASCHHPVPAPSAVVTIPSKEGPGFSAWNRTGMVWLLEDIRRSGAEGPSDQALITALENLATQMEPLRSANAVEVARNAREARHALDAWLQGATGQRELRSFDANQLARIVAAAESESLHDSWEESVQAYLAKIASRAAWPDGPDGATARMLRQWQQELRYPAGRNSRR